MTQEKLLIEKLMRARQDKKLELDEVADNIGLDRRTLWNIEQNKTPLKLPILFKLCDFYQINPSNLFGKEERNILDSTNCFILANNDYGTFYFSASEEQLMNKVPKNNK